VPNARSREGRSTLPRLITRNFGLKLLALSLSLMLFSLVHSDVDAQRTIFLPVVQTVPPATSGKMLISPLPAQVKVTLRGSRSKLSSLSRDELAPLQIDLTDTSQRYYYFDPNAIDVGSNVRVIEISPAMVALDWAVAGERRIPVHVQLEGELERGYALEGDVEVNPGSITLRGPEKVLEGINTVSTEPMSLIGLGLGKHTRRVPLEPAPGNVTYIEDTAVEVRLSVRPMLAERTFKRLEVACLGDAQVEVRPERVDVTLRGAQELLASLEPDALVPYIEPWPGLGAGTRLYEIKLRGVPEGTEVVRILPPSSLVRSKGKR
jgi:YbbR domain-containing protein